MSTYTKFVVVPVIAILGACTTYDAQTAATTETEALVVASAPADTEEAVAADVVENSGEVQEVAKVDKDRVICKRKIVTGSRFTKNICMKWSEWKALEDQSKSVTQEGLRRSRQVDVPTGG